MAVVSAFASYRNVAKFAQVRLVGNLWRQTCISSGRTGQATHVIRQMSHKRTMQIKPSTFEWQKFKDHLHFYVTLAIVPVATIVGCTNLFIGPAELADIPEDYEPKHWEYHKHPISRFISRYLLDPPQKMYERHLHFLNVEYEKIQMRKLEQKVKLLVGDVGKRYDSKLWYYVPVTDRPPHSARKILTEECESDGFK